MLLVVLALLNIHELVRFLDGIADWERAAIDSGCKAAPMKRADARILDF